MYCVWLVSSFFKQEIRVKFCVREKQGFTSENSFTFHDKTVFFFTNLSPLADSGCLKTWRNYCTLRQDLKAANKLGRVMHLHNIYLQCNSWLPTGKNRRTLPQKHPDKWKPLKIFILQYTSALALHLQTSQIPLFSLQVHSYLNMDKKQVSQLVLVPPPQSGKLGCAAPQSKSGSRTSKAG